MADMVVHALSDEGIPTEGSLEQLQSQLHGWRPWWPDLRIGLRPPLCIMVWDPCEWQHGWQFWTPSVSDSQLGKTNMLRGCTAAATHSWMLRDSSGDHGGQIYEEG